MRTVVSIEGWARAFIEAPRQFGTLATIELSGMPLQAVVWYALRGDAILVNSRVGRRWPANLLRDSRASLMVFDEYGYVAIYGRAEHLYDDQRALEDIFALARAYEEPEVAERIISDTFSGQHRISFLLWPEQVLTHR